jgi:hypothetical protein
MGERWAFGSGTLTAQMFGPGVILVKASGVQDDPRLVEAFADWFARLPSRDGGYQIYCDAELNSGCEPATRELVEHWLERNRPRVASVVVLVRTQLMAMAVAIANLSTGGLSRVTFDRLRFQSLLATALHERDGRGTISASA